MLSNVFLYRKPICSGANRNKTLKLEKKRKRISKFKSTKAPVINQALWLLDARLNF